jgi:hypothetical protein
MNRDDYLAMRTVYEPKEPKLVIVAESPPASGKYFYNPEGSISEALFSAFMKHLGQKPTTKAEGLDHFKNQGWILVDATYTPVNALTHGPSRDEVINEGFEQLKKDLKRLTDGRSDTPVILIKANVCRRLEPRLKEAGFKVLNAGRIIYFPSSGRQGEFQSQFAEVVKDAGL